MSPDNPLTTARENAYLASENIIVSEEGVLELGPHSVFCMADDDTLGHVLA